jgi:hypothetical protein
VDEWPFADPKNLAVITVRPIVQDGHPVLRLSHDSDDGGWQFLEWGTPQEEDAMVVSLYSMVVRDSSLKELADLPLGWRALRPSPRHPWVREPDTDR